MNEELEGIELEDVELDPELDEEERDSSALAKAWDAVREAFHLLGETDLSKADKKVTNAAKGALRILAKYNTPDAPDWLKKAVAALAEGLGYGKPEYYGKPKAKKSEDEVEKAQGAGALVNTVKSFLKVANKHKDELPEEVWNAVENLATALGYGKPESYPEVKKSEADEKLLAELEKHQERLEKMEQELEKARHDKRVMELQEISKSIGGFDPEKLYDLEAQAPDLFEELVKHMQALHSRVQESELLKEVGTEASVMAGPMERLHQAAQELLEKGGAKDYADALATVSAMPEYRNLVPAAMGGVQ